jgi:hypothetical protein
LGYPTSSKTPLRQISVKTWMYSWQSTSEHDMTLTSTSQHAFISPYSLISSATKCKIRKKSDLVFSLWIDTLHTSFWTPKGLRYVLPKYQLSHFLVSRSDALVVFIFSSLYPSFYYFMVALRRSKTPMGLPYLGFPRSCLFTLSQLLSARILC